MTAQAPQAAMKEMKGMNGTIQGDDEFTADQLEAETEQAYREGVLEGLARAAKAMCSLCATLPTQIGDSPRWWHRASDRSRGICNAGFVHDEIAKALRGQ